MGIVQETPSTYRGATDWQAYVEQIDANPGTWYNVGEFSPGTTHHLRTGVYKAFLHGKPDSTPAEVWMRQKYEITSRRPVSGVARVVVYIRRIPDGA